jgi:anti-sigma-K factor RskA
MTHDELRELTGGYALGILSEPERRELEAHLPGCPACAEEVRSFAQVASGLALAVPQVDPPAALRARVLRAAVAGSLPHRASVDQPKLGSSLPTWLAAAASLAAVALGLYSLTLRQRIGSLEDQLRDAQERVVTVEGQVAVHRSRAEAVEERYAIVTAADRRQINLSGKEQAPNAVGEAIWSPSRGLVFTASNLPQPPPGRQYQLWVIPPGAGSAPVSAGMLDLDPSGSATRLSGAPSSLPVAAVAVSLEPAGGVPAPTGPIVLVGSL